MKLVWFPHFGVWVTTGRRYLILTIRIRGFYWRRFFGRNREAVQ